nr:NAD(P)/FAD-dependent oxidoreductase [Dehalococcoidia bacterium]
MTSNQKTRPVGISPILDTVVVGAGFAGLYQLYKLRQLGLQAIAFEAGGDVGGTWYWNRYPGARCDVESMAYSYSFSEELEQEWVWAERYASQPEILKYARHVADRFDLKKDIRFNTRVLKVTFEENNHRWLVTTSKNETFSAKFVIMALGCLSSPHSPSIPGLDTFEGNCYHTGFWPHKLVDFTGENVGVIGTGSSATQAIPLIAEQAEHLTIFQRTANFSIPAWNKPLTKEIQHQWKDNYRKLRVEAKQSSSGIINMDSDQNAADLTSSQQQKELERRWKYGGLIMWNAFADIMKNRESNDVVSAFVHKKIREVVKDPATADLLCPKNYPLGSKRLCVDTNCFEAFNKPNVTLADINSHPIKEITAAGIETSGGFFKLDSIVLATGFDAMTG